MSATKLFCSRSSPRSLGRGRLVHGSCVLAGWNALFSLHKDKDSSCGQYQHVMLTSYAFLCCIGCITIYVKDWDSFLWPKLDTAPAGVFSWKAWSSDGLELATGDQAGQVRLWHAGDKAAGDTIETLSSPCKELEMKLPTGWGGGVRPWVVDFVKEASGILIFGLAQFFMKLFESSNRPYFKNLNEATKHKMMWSVRSRSSHDLLAEDCFEVPSAAASRWNKPFNPQKRGSKCARHLP